MPIDSVDTLLALLERLRLLLPQEVQQIQRDLVPHFRDPLDLAYYLAEIEWLTEFQIGLLFDGRWDELTIGPYLILDRLGEGGVSEVYKAWDTVKGRTVALKVLHQHLTERTSAVREFQRELQAVTRLSHPNIIRIFDAHQFGAVHYFAMEYLEGLDLDRYVRQVGRLSIEEACEYARQVAQGLQHAHQLGLVHRDIKPANLFLVNPPSPPTPLPSGERGERGASLPAGERSESRTPLPAGERGRGEGNASGRRAADPQIKVLDWNLARLRGDGGEAERAGLDRDAEKGMLIGTPDYIAPEQARDPCLVDIRADVYSLGCTLYFLLTGQPPFPGTSLMQKLMQHQEAERPTVRQLRPDVPEELAAVVQRMMARLPEERYAIPLLVAGALRHFGSAAGDLSFRAKR